MDIAVVLVCHGAYLPLLAECIRSIDGQTHKAKEKVLALDDCEPPEWMKLSTWKIVRGKWGSPNPGRNLGVQSTISPWIVFFDADNVMPATYLEEVRAKIATAKSNVGFIYPTICYTDDKLQMVRRLDVPEWDYWTMRERTYVDTSAAWRRDAIDTVGGWPDQQLNLDDYAMAMKMTAKGWHGLKGGFQVMMRQHKIGQRRSTVCRNDDKLERSLWTIRTLGIVTLFAGRGQTFDDWWDFILGAHLPPKTSLYIVDNSDDPAFLARLSKALADLASTGRFRSITRIVEANPFRFKKDDEYKVPERHKRVADLYNLILPKVDDDFVLTLEDDMCPPHNGIWELMKLFKPYGTTGIVGSAYPSGHNPEHVCAAKNRDIWNDVPKMSDLGTDAVEYGFVGGGFTLYNNAIVKRSLPLISRPNHKGYLMGWDGHLCYLARGMGYRVVLHQGVRPEHNAWGMTRAPAIASPKARLSICIGVLDETDELLKTIQSIRDTSGDKCEIVIVDDGSVIPVHQSLKGHSNQIRLHRTTGHTGSGAAKHLAVEIAKYDSVLILDAHMRFLTGWYEMAIDRIEEPDTAWNPCCLGLEEGFMDPAHPRGIYFGAKLHFHNNGEVFEAKWESEKEDIEYDVPCLMGGAYFFPRSLFLNLGGFSGLQKWGVEEQFISLKMWLAGHRIRMAKEIKIGHKFRSAKSPAPYTVAVPFVIANKMLAMRTIMGRESAVKLEQMMPMDGSWMMARHWTDQRQPQIDIENQRLQAIFKHDCRWYAERFNVEYPAST